MNLREITENNERQFLSQFAFKSDETKGRQKKTPLCEIRTEFQRDRDRIIHSKAFRRLMHKTQVFISPEQDHFRTRLTHTLEVSQISRTISKALRLNETLTEAIALGHDLGHTPFGHTGEDIIDKISVDGFRHNEHSIRVVEKLENSGDGLNLTEEVLDGILNHRSSLNPKTLEGKVVQLSDKIAYINHDIDDSIRAKVLKQSDIPKKYLEILGGTCSQRIDFLVKDVIFNSYEKNYIKMSENAKEALYGLRDFMFDTVYLSQLQLKEKNKIEYILSEIYYFYEKNIEKLPYEFLSMIQNGEKKEKIVIDYIAGMTDRYAVRLFSNLFMPSNFKIYP